jgi:hypothetical protein
MNRTRDPAVPYGGSCGRLSDRAICLESHQTNLANVRPNNGMLRLDFFPKFIDSAMTKKTNLGAVISITMVVTAVCLCWSETWSFLQPSTKN